MSAYDQVGNRLHEDRGQLALDNGFNNLNQLTARRFGGRLDLVGTVTTTNLPVAVKVDGQPAALFQGTNYWGGARVAPGSNVASIVACDAVSNRTEALRTFRMPLTNPERFQYDLNGNLTNDGWRTYAWDEENRLTSVETVAGTVPGTSRARGKYRYDGFGRRVQKVDYTQWSEEEGRYTRSNVTRLVWAGWTLLAEMTASNTVSAYYTWGLDVSGRLNGAGGVGGLLAVNQGGACYLAYGDGNGNVTDYVDASGTVVAHREYDPFGRTVALTGSKKGDFTFWFSSKYCDTRWDLYYYGYRWCSPDLGRWLSNDPIGISGGLNTYAGCANNPINRIDSLGLNANTLSLFGPGGAVDYEVTYYGPGGFTAVQGASISSYVEPVLCGGAA